MIQLKIYEFGKPDEFYNLVCGEFKMLSNTLKFQHTAKHYQSDFDDYSALQLDDTFTPQILQFKSITRKRSEVDLFKKFISGANRQFVIEITKENETRFVFARYNNELIMQVETAKIEMFDISFKTQTNYLKRTTFIANLEDEQQPEDDGYAENVDSLEGYEYDIEYGVDVNTLDAFRVPIGDNTGNRKAFLIVDMLRCEDNPSFGLNERADLVYLSYRSKNLNMSINDRVRVSSVPIPVLKGMRRYLNNETTNFINVENLREFEETIGYVHVPFGTENNVLIFSGVRQVKVEKYEQFINF